MVILRGAKRRRRIHASPLADMHREGFDGYSRLISPTGLADTRFDDFRMN